MEGPAISALGGGGGDGGRDLLPSTAAVAEVSYTHEAAENPFLIFRFLFF